MLISENARVLFAKRQQQVLDLIEHSGIEYKEIGIFGSYARGDCKTTSDIDFLVIVPKHPDRYISGELREQAAEWNADIVYMTRDYFLHDNRPFTISVRRDYQCLSIMYDVFDQVNQVRLAHTQWVHHVSRQSLS